MRKIFKSLLMSFSRLVERMGNYILENHILSANYDGLKVTPEMNGYWFRYYNIALLFVLLGILNICISLLLKVNL